MSLLDKASLVVTPNAYKESKLYSVIPSDGSGDMTVVRATTATRVNSAGLIEDVPYNLLQRSEQFDNAIYTKTFSSISANATTSPNGTLIADKLIEDTANNQHRIDQTTTSVIGTNTFSVFAKKSERDSLWLRVGTSGGYFDLTNGTISGDVGVTASIESLPNGWYRCIITRTSTVSNEIVRINLAIGTNGTYLGDGTSGIFIWGAQLVTGSVAKDYFQTTDKLNIPRIDYTNGSCPSLLVEPQRTNLLTYSNDYSNVSWGKVGVTATLGTQVNPEGIASTYSISNTTLGDSYLQKQGLSTTAGNYTMSVFVKNVDNVVSSQLMAVHLTQGSVTSQFTYTWATNTFTLAGTNAISGSSVLLSNGWVRLTFTYSIGAGVVNHWARLYANNNLTITKSVLVYGFQTEAGSYPTSYIPTVASSVTRNADLISKTGISSLINSLEGVLFVDLQFLTGIGNIRSIHISNGDNNNRIGFYGHPSIANRITFAISSGGVTTDINFNGVTLTNRNKVLIRYSGTTFTSFINGVKSTNQTFTPFAANFLNRIGLDYGEDILRYEGRINSIQLYKTALTDAECIALTTL